MNRVRRLRDSRARTIALLGLALGLASPSGGNPHHPDSCPVSTIRFILASDVYKYRVEEGTLVPRYASLVKEALAESGVPTYHILAGDFLMPTIYGTLFGGDPILKIWSALKISLAVPGNHEFDIPYDALVTAVRRSRFPWVCSNCKDKTSGQPYAGMVSHLFLETGGVKVGFVGIISPRLWASFSATLHPNLEITEPLDAAESATRALRDAGACLVVAVTHQELAEDRILGELVPEIAVILGGHTHTVQTSVVGSTFAFRTGHDLQYFGTATVLNDDPPVITFTTVPVIETIPEDPEMKTLLKEFEWRVEEVLKGDWARLPSMQDLRSSVVRTGGGLFPSAVADIVREATGADAVLLNSGMFRGDRVFPAGKWPLRFLYEILPFPSRVYVLEVPGEALKSALEWGLKDFPVPSGAFPVVSGAEIAFDASRPPLNRIKGIRFNGTPLREDAVYNVAVTSFLRFGGDGYTMFSGLPLSASSPQELDLMAVLIGHSRKGAAIPLRTSLVRPVRLSEPASNGVE